MKTLSLKMRAITLLSQREHSRTELRQKLIRILRRDLAAEASTSRTASEDADSNPTSEGLDPADQVEALLDWLQQQGYLSDARFVESRIHARAARYGDLRIKQELAQHGLSLSAEKLTTLKEGEYERAKAIWQRKFGGQVAQDLAMKAKQMRFMIARGFSSETVRKLLNAKDE
ncbi:RecX family transcriptional regulator [Paucibacter sp. Y2R2-4]|uniref:RecX family transcriptional regulator n=1 Tax=Paucibacter sp. Y2R2-4 TaxID=2893553 RepID=UPI0021E41D5A|nr:RecX family transcriptional regulator [Paucibacter sp. Y2R2-4]MCV2351618.1 RecX family transcriptional regulator [Paucibacter sp. Y2R2-4]